MGIKNKRTKMTTNRFSFRIHFIMKCALKILLIFVALAIPTDSLLTRTQRSQVTRYRRMVDVGDSSSAVDARVSPSRRRRSAPGGEIASSMECARVEGAFLEEVKRNENIRKSFLEERLIVITGENGESTVYLSDEKGKNFSNITSVVEGSIDHSELMLIKHPNDSKIVYILSNSLSFFAQASRLHITVDGGKKFDLANLPAQTFDASSFFFHPTNTNLVLAVSVSNQDLYLSTDKGYKWNKIKSNILQAKWSTMPGSTDIYVVTTNETDMFIRMYHNSKDNTLERSRDLGQTWKIIYNRVYTFGMEGKFLYTSSYLPMSYTEERFLVVSIDGGESWNHAQLPSITPDRFYAILDMSEGQIFLHVDNPGDTGHGTLYTSDATGIIFTESLKMHLYPNYEDLTDFYKVSSMRGVYIASQLEEDNSIHTVITYDRGGVWQNIPRPERMNCTDEKKACYLQIHNLYGSSTIPPPLSVSNAIGLILVHGHVAEALQTTLPDVFVSNDGGYSWKFALAGPHHYQIADHGGLLVAVPADTDTPNVVKFSTDEGRCWIPYTFTDEKVVFTGLLAEPGNRDMIVAIWGYTQDNRTWHTFVLNFTSVIDRQCDADKDYEDFLAHQKNSDSGCLLGSKDTFRRLKANSWCYNGRSYQVTKTVTTCPCTLEDFDCDYGYYRKSDAENCIKDPKVSGAEIDICTNGHEEKIVPRGYHKIPGDKCVGGVMPAEAEIVDLTQLCSDSEPSLLAAHMQAAPTGDPQPERSKLIVIGLFALVGLVIAMVFITFIARKYRIYRQKIGYRYSSIRCEVDDDADAGVAALRHNTSLYVDTSDDEMSPIEQGTKANILSTSNGRIPNGGIASSTKHLANSQVTGSNGHVTNKGMAGTDSKMAAPGGNPFISGHGAESDDEILE